MPDPFGTPYRMQNRNQPKKVEAEKLSPFLEFWVKFFASGCYTGYIPVAPGTAGTALAVFMWQYFNRIPVDPLGKFLILAGMALFGVWISTMAERVYNRGDANIIVIDEIVGFLIAASFLRPGTYENEFRLLLITFVIFRVLDIVKPFPLRQLEQLPRGWGVMADDVGAGLVTLLAMYLPLNFWIKALDLHVKTGGGN